MNDRCNAKGKDDGLTGFSRVWVKRPEEYSIVTQPADFGGCTSAPSRFAVFPWQGALPIEAGGVQACVGRYVK